MSASDPRFNQGVNSGTILSTLEVPRRAVIESVEEEISAAVAKYAPAILESPEKLGPLTLTLMINVFDTFAHRYLLLVSDDVQFRTFYLPALDRVSKKLVAKTDQLTSKSPGLWPEKRRKINLSLLESYLLGRKQHWKAQAMKRLRESKESKVAAATAAARTEAEAQQLRGNVPAKMAPSDWQEVEIWFVSDERVQIKVGEYTETRNYTEFGFEDGRTKKPDRAWVTLRELAKLGGTIRQATDSRGWDIVEKRMQEIRNVFRNCFSLSDDPLPFVKGTGYRARFKISCAPSFDS